MIDFRKATNHFADQAFDGPVIQVYEPQDDDPVAPPENVPLEEDGETPLPPEPGKDETVVVDPTPPDISIRTGSGKPSKYYVKGKPVSVLTERVEYLDENGKLITESLRDFSRKALKQRFASLDEFLNCWNGVRCKQAIIDELAHEGLLLEPLAEEVGKDFDPFDLICHVAFDRKPLTRRERANNVRKRDVFTKYGEKARAVLEALIQKYQDAGYTDLDNLAVLKVSPFDTMGTPVELLKPFGGKEGFEKAVRELQAALYLQAA